MGKSAFLKILKIHWIIRYNHIQPLNFWGLTYINFGNKLKCDGFNKQKKKSFTMQYLFNYII